MSGVKGEERTEEEGVMQQSLPTYLNVAFVRKALEAAFGAVAISKCNIELSEMNGENFCSNIYRVHVTYRKHGKLSTSGSDEEGEVMLFVKDMIQEISDVGSNECAMYEQVLPVMEQLLVSAFESEVRLNAKCFLCDRDKKEVFVLEDLTQRGYKSANRYEGLDATHSRVLLEKIAQFHGASMMYAEKFSSATASLRPSHFAVGAADPLAKAIAMGGMEHAVRIVETWEDFTDLAEKMRANIPKFDAKIMTLVDPNHCKVRVINHGDLWVNNFLFHYDGAQPKDVLFVDFQNCFLGSPGFDINYFLYTSVQLDVLKSERFDLLRCYYRALKKTLTGLNYREIPTWQTILEEIRNCEFLGYYAAVCELPICCMNKETSVGFTAATFTDPQAMAQKNKMLYENPRVVATLRYTLDHFNEMRVLD